MAKKILVTGSAGLIGSESVKFFCAKDYEVIGIDNNMREYFFGREASTEWNRKLLEKKFKKQYFHYQIDIRNATELEKIFKRYNFDLIIHTAAQPSHDWAAKEPLTDFTVNALGTLLLLEQYRRYCPKAVFIFTSTNKVYGDRPNSLSLVETATRYELAANHPYYSGIDETMSIDATKHSVFGASKVSADVMVQEYGRYFGLSTGVFRGGCLTGPSHSGTKLHGFLAYLARCIYRGEQYSIFGYKGKQVRDNIHALDLVNAFYQFYKQPQAGEVYNIGGSRFSNVSVLEAIKKIEKILKKKAKYKIIQKPRIGDHIWYISDTKKFSSQFPRWRQRYDGDSIIEEICHLGHFD